MDGLSADGGEALSELLNRTVVDKGECVLFDFRWRNILRSEYARFFSTDDDGDDAGEDIIVPFPVKSVLAAAPTAAEAMSVVEPDSWSSCTCTGNTNPVPLPSSASSE